MQRTALLCLIVVLISVLTVGCGGGTKDGRGSGSAVRVNVAEAAKSAGARAFPASHEDGFGRMVLSSSVRCDRRGPSVSGSRGKARGAGSHSGSTSSRAHRPIRRRSALPCTLDD